MQRACFGGVGNQIKMKGLDLSEILTRKKKQKEKKGIVYGRFNFAKKFGGGGLGLSPIAPSLPVPTPMALTPFKKIFNVKVIQVSKVNVMHSYMLTKS